MATRLQVTGMTCGNCVKHVTHALQGVPGVLSVQVDLAGGTAVIDGDADRQLLVSAVAAAGYDAT